MKLKDILKKIFTPFFNTKAAGLYIVLFALIIGIATFVENDFGTSAAQKTIFKTWWFELLLLLFSITLVVNIIKFRMVQQKKWPLLLFHISFIIILFGAGVTRYFSFEGMMHIREGSASNSFLSSDNYLQFRILNGKDQYAIDEKVLFASLGRNSFEQTYKIKNDQIKVEVKKVIPNPKQKINASKKGKPMVKIVFGGASGREEFYVSYGETKNLNGVIFNFSETTLPDAFNIQLKGDALFFQTAKTYTQMTMATQALDTLNAQETALPLKLRSLYSDGSNSFVIGEFVQNGEIEIVSEKRKIESESVIGIWLNVSINEKSEDFYIYGQTGVQGTPYQFSLGNIQFAAAYGAKIMEIPFQLKLNDFIMERYPGTNSAASYASEVTLIDPRNNHSQDYRIFMNNILNYGGYRFFQSSFDQDEAGTYLSVNHDFWGTWISYLGYILLTLGMIWTFFSKKTRFYQLSQKIKHLKPTAAAALLMFALTFSGEAKSQEVLTAVPEHIKAEHAEIFSRIVVQDMNGRMKPMHSLTRELMRKVYGKERFSGLNADQVILSMFAIREDWFDVPFIKIGPHTQTLLNTKEKLASYSDFFNEEGNYRLMTAVSEAYNKKPIDRGTLEKELLKIDERVNIVGMIFSGDFFKIIPVPNDPNHTWSSATQHGETSIKNPLATSFFENYVRTLHRGVHDNNYGLADTLLLELGAFQWKQSAAVMPSKTKQSAEILLNNLDVFGRLALMYTFLGLGFLILLFTTIFKPAFRVHTLYLILLWLLFAGFLFHTFGLGMRWYISGRAPWSNGYESMIYIAWTTALAGIIFTRKSLGGLAATMILSGTVLLIAKLSYLDPEITPLVPVLKSYWLTIHVSLEAGSYGFLMLGAIIGLINLILMTFLTERNKAHITKIITEMSYISEMTLIGGIAMLSIGTYLGGVWANESWGRYWGWDAKETWALVSILVYAFILHMRIIPKLTGLYAFNVATLFGLSSIVMTYFGVNYYLSGLHSYAAGDPVPVPGWVYITVISFILISLVAYWNKKRLKVKL